jgi:hypothetical protein
VNRAIAESFLSGYRVILLVAIGLVLASSLSAQGLNPGHPSTDSPKHVLSAQ